jgi:hypothetical protein
MVEGNFKNKQSGLKRGTRRPTHRYSYIDTLALVIFTALLQPLGQWLLRYMLNEIEDFKSMNYFKFTLSLVSFIFGLVLSIIWYKLSRSNK